MNTSMPIHRRLIALLLFILAPGCATNVTAPQRVKDPAIVYVTDYGKHSSILLPAPAGGYDEYAYGDYNWFALGQVSVRNAFIAMLVSPKATLGTRHIPIHQGQVEIEDLAGCIRLTEFAVDRTRAESLEMTLAATFRKAAGSPIHSDFSGLEHIEYSHHYWLFHNCNHATADWLRDLGCKVNGPAILSNFQVAPD